MQLHYQSLGQGKPLVLLHGLFGSSDNWGTIAKHFAQRYQVISVDLRNHGKSPHSDSQTYAMMTEDLIDLCHSLNFSQIHLLGHSLGGKVAMHFASQHPEKVDQLVIVDMAMRAYADVHTHLIDAMLAIDLSTMQSRSEVDKVLSGSIQQTMVRQFLLLNLVKSDKGLRWRINLSALKANYHKMQQSVCESTHYTKPSLFIRGEFSDYIRNDDMHHIRAHFTSAQFISLPTDHWVHAEQPQAFIKVVSEFLTD